MRYYYCQKLTEELQQEIQMLHQKCEQYDETAIPLYAENEEDDFPYLKFYMAMDNEKLTGFLSLYNIDGLNAFAYAIVDPDYRKQHIFTHLLAQLPKEYLDITFPVAHASQSARECLDHMHAEYLNSECTMSLDLNNYKVNPVSLSGSSPKIKKQETGGGISYEIYDKDHKLGHANIFFSDSQACLYDVKIKKKNRSKGYGSYLLSYILNDLIHKKSCQALILQVRRSNEIAFSWYQRLGFQVVEQLDYFNFPKLPNGQ